MRSAALLLPLMMLATSAIAQEPAREARPRTITTSGTATVYVVPDEATLQFSVETFDAELPKAKELNDKAAEEVLGFLKSTGIEAKDIQTSSVTSTAIYDESMEYNRRRRGPIRGYDVTRQYGVKLRDLSKLGTIYDKLLPDSRVILQGQSLTTTELRKHRDKARLDALKLAREKAELLAQAAGAKVGAVREINESTPFVGYSRGFSNMQSQVSSDMGSGGGSDNVSPVGQIEVQATVTIVYDLVPNERSGE